jgi:hypothetical protein
MLFVLIVVVLLLVIGVAGLGYYREWYRFGTTSNPDTGQTEIQLKVDQKKVQADIDEAKQRVRPASGEQDGK